MRSRGSAGNCRGPGPPGAALSTSAPPSGGRPGFRQRRGRGKKHALAHTDRHALPPHLIAAAGRMARQARIRYGRSFGACGAHRFIPSPAGLRGGAGHRLPKSVLIKAMEGADIRLRPRRESPVAPGGLANPFCRSPPCLAGQKQAWTRLPEESPPDDSHGFRRGSTPSPVGQAPAARNAWSECGEYIPLIIALDGGVPPRKRRNPPAAAR